MGTKRDLMIEALQARHLDKETVDLIMRMLDPFYRWVALGRAPLARIEEMSAKEIIQIIRETAGRTAEKIAYVPVDTPNPALFSEPRGGRGKCEFAEPKRYTTFGDVIWERFGDEYRLVATDRPKISVLEPLYFSLTQDLYPAMMRSLQMHRETKPWDNLASVLRLYVNAIALDLRGIARQVEPAVQAFGRGIFIAGEKPSEAGTWIVLSGLNQPL